MISLASIDYFSLQGIPFILIAIFNIWIFQPVVTTIHELGHGLPAFFLTKGKVRIRVGEGKGFFFRRPYQLGDRFSFKISFNKTQIGHTQFEEPSKVYQLIILLGGPLVTFLLTLQAIDLLFAAKLPSWAELLLISWFCGNFLALLRSVIPTRLKPSRSFPQGPPSDGLQIIHLLFGSSNKEV
jgi:hypothetical protein